MESTGSSLSPLVAHLIALPDEIVDQILSDLPVYNVLKLVCQDEPRLLELILRHPHYKHLLPSPIHLASAKAFFELYCEIYRSFQYKMCRKDQPLASSFSTSRQLTHSGLVTFLIRCILKALQEELPRVELLCRYSPVPMSSTLPHLSSSSLAEQFETATILRERWNQLQAAEENFNTIKSKQLTRLTNILIAHPKLLKKTFDPSQQLRPNREHIIDRFRRDVTRILRSRILVGRFRCRAHFGFDYLPLVPYDRYLQLFLAGLALHPPVDSGTAHGHLASMSLAAAEKVNAIESKVPSSFSYPADIARDTVTVTEGLSYIYAIPLGKKEKDLRTKGTRYSAPPYNVASSQQAAVFVIPNYRKQEIVGRELKETNFYHPKRHSLWGREHPRKLRVRLHPFDEREFRWLEAFLRCVDFMEKNEAFLSCVEDMERNFKADSEGDAKAMVDDAAVC